MISASADIDDYFAWLGSAGQHNLLSEDAERQLLETVVAGRAPSASDEARRAALEARDLLVVHNLRLVVSVVLRLPSRGMERIDLVQWAHIGLLRAIQKFDLTKEVRFSTYAMHWIRQAVTRASMEQGELIRVPVHASEDRQRLERARDTLIAQGQLISVEALAAASGLSVRRVQALQEMARCVDTIDRDVAVGNHDLPLVESLVAPQPAPLDVASQAETAATVARALQRLDQRSEAVLRLRFGFEDGREWTLQEIGERLGVSRERVRQIERDALATLRGYVALRELAEELQHAD